MDAAVTSAKYAGARILVADDDPVQREVLSGLVALLGATCTAVADGKAALDAYLAAGAGHFKLVFTDINMPVMGGFELAQRIRLSGRADAETIPVLGVSGDADPELFDLAVRAGMNGMTSKPVSAEVLRAYLTLLVGEERMNAAFAARLKGRVERDRRTRDFAVGVCRDLRVPLQAIRGFADLLAAGGLSSAERVNYAKSIATAVERVAKLMNDAEIELSAE